MKDKHASHKASEFKRIKIDGYALRRGHREAAFETLFWPDVVRVLTPTCYSLR